MPDTATTKRLNDLIRLLEHTCAMYGQLLETVQAKIDAVRRADLNAMREQTGKEHALAGRLHEREGLRCRLMEAIGKELDIPARQARDMTMSQLASYVSSGDGQRLSEISCKLREMVSRVAQANRIAGVTTREILNHLKWVLDSVKPKDEQPAGYDGDGTAIPASGNKIFETVG